jgi:uncharacterized protein YjbJ (UPF0337 family)
VLHIEGCRYFGHWPVSPRQRCFIDKERVKGAADKVVGKSKEVAGQVTGDKKLETEGNVDQAKGAFTIK